MTAVRPAKPRPVRSYLKGLIATVLAIVLGIVAFVAIKATESEERTEREQTALAPFYRPPDGWQETALGMLLRKERVQGVPAGGTGWRVLYRSERSDGSPSVSGGLVFVPSGDAPVGGRPVVAWAHGTVGLGAACAPSRTPDVTKDVPGLAQFLRAGWVVTATDYSGLGTRGTLEYLVGEAEARDVLNSVRAARGIPDADPSARVALWGHSQGGHSVLWTAASAEQLAPELDIIATAAAAPAAELEILFAKQWDSVIGSLIGSEVLISWPPLYPGTDVRDVVNPDIDFRRIAERCIISGLVDLQIRSYFGQQSFRIDPMTIPGWRDAAVTNIPPLPLGVPTLIAQGLVDEVVFPRTTATYTERACAAGADLTSLWLGDTGHGTAGFVAAPSAFAFFEDVFAGRVPAATCANGLPVRPFPAD